VDVENVERISATLDISKRFFSANEYTDLLKVPKHLQKQYFFYYWTLKEAYIKAKGKGIHIPLDQFSYDLKTKDKISVNFDASLGDDPQDWQFMLINIDQKYRSALAINRGKTENMKVDIREVVPLDSEKDLNYRIIAQ